MDKHELERQGAIVDRARRIVGMMSDIDETISHLSVVTNQRMLFRRIVPACEFEFDEDIKARVCEKYVSFTVTTLLAEKKLLEDELAAL